MNKHSREHLNKVALFSVVTLSVAAFASGGVLVVMRLVMELMGINGPKGELLVALSLTIFVLGLCIGLILRGIVQAPSIDSLLGAMGPLARKLLIAEAQEILDREEA